MDYVITTMIISFLAILTCVAILSLTAFYIVIGAVLIGALSIFAILKLKKAAKKNASGIDEAIMEAYSEIPEEIISEIKHEKPITLDEIFNRLSENRTLDDTDTFYETVEIVKRTKKERV